MLVLILLAFAIYKLRSEPKQKEAFDRTPSELIYTKHALCRMECRKISKADIDEVIRGGNYRLIVRIIFRVRTIYIKFVGTHKQYDKVNLDDL